MANNFNTGDRGISAAQLAATVATNSAGSILGASSTALIGLWGTAAVDQPAAVTSLTDNSAGAATDTLQACPDPGDTPITADALRDDIVANLLPAIRNNFADLAAKMNTVISRLREPGVIDT